MNPDGKPIYYCATAYLIKVRRHPDLRQIVIGTALRDAELQQLRELYGDERVSCETVSASIESDKFVPVVR